MAKSIERLCEEIVDLAMSTHKYWTIKSKVGQILQLTKEPTQKGRISIDDYYLNIAKAVSLRSSCLIRQYGAVVVKNGEIISTGYNGSPRGSVNCCDTEHCKRYDEGDHTHNDGNYNSCESVHAEMNALLSASRSEMIESTLYLYGSEKGKTIDCEPCPICSRLIKNAGVVRVVCSKNA